MDQIQDLMIETEKLRERGGSNSEISNSNMEIAEEIAWGMEWEGVTVSRLAGYLGVSESEIQGYLDMLPEDTENSESSAV